MCIEVSLFNCVLDARLRVFVYFSPADKWKINEETDAILNEDLIKIIDLANPQNTSEKVYQNRFNYGGNCVDSQVLNEFSNNLCLEDKLPVNKIQDSEKVRCFSDSKSLFKEINERYEQFVRDNQKSESNENFMDMDDTDLENFVESRMNKSEENDIWDEHSKQVLEHAKCKGNHFILFKKCNLCRDMGQ